MKNLCEFALNEAKKGGAEQVRVNYNEAEQSSFIVLNDKLDRLQYSSGRSLYIQLFYEGRYGSFSTNRMERGELAQFIKKGLESTKLLAKDPCRQLADPALYFKGEAPDLKQYDDSYSKVRTEHKRDIAFNVANQILGKDGRVLSLNAEYEETFEHVYMLDSQGFEGKSDQTLYTVSAECSVKDKGGRRPDGWWFHSSMFLDKLDIANCGTTALDRALKQLGPRKLKSGKYNIVIENTLSSRLIAPIFSALNGSSIQQMNSFLLNSKGKQIFSKEMNLYDDPHRIGAMGSRYYDSEGIATKKMDIIKEGVVSEYFINTYYAKKLSIEPTIEGPSVPILRNNENLTLKGIIKKVNNGIFITGFNGGNCNMGTGDFSYGIQGFLIKDGEILYPVKEMNMTGNMISLWNNILYIGNDPRDCAKWMIPTLSFRDVNISGI